MSHIVLDDLPNDHDKQALIAACFGDDGLSVSFAYEAKFENAKCLRDFVETVCNMLHMCEKAKSRMILVTDELNNNAIEHGSSQGGTNILRIRTFQENGSTIFNLEVQDDGKGRRSKTALEMETLRAHKLKRGYGSHDSIRGRGLFLITVQIADRLYFKNAKEGGLIVGIKLKIDTHCD